MINTVYGKPLTRDAALPRGAAPAQLQLRPGLEILIILALVTIKMLQHILKRRVNLLLAVTGRLCGSVLFSSHPFLSRMNLSPATEGHHWSYP